MIVYDRIENTLYKTSIKLSIKPKSMHGLLLYSGRFEKDFISVGLSNGYVIFQFDLGSGPAFIKSETKTNVGEWTTITAWRDGSTGHLKISGQKKTTMGRSLGRFNGLNLKGELFIGGFEDYEKLFGQTKHDSGFEGCMSELAVNDKKMDFGTFVCFHLISNLLDVGICVIIMLAC